MTGLERLKIRREGVTLKSRLDEAKAELLSIRSDYDYLDPEILDVLCFPVQQQINHLREKMLSNVLHQFLFLSEAEQDRVIEAVKLEEQRMRGDCH